MSSGEESYILKTKIFLAEPDGSAFMGIGVLWLLQYIREGGSIRQAAAKMNMSYAKAHRMLKAAEARLGLQLVLPKRGGERREGACLTPAGEEFISLYDDFQKSIKKDAQQRFKLFQKELSALRGRYDPEV
ncbi:MAG TPA: LysR family transcriptional regulator [Sediminispirochaeta sp.]|nr:LysR family transcriptional regulator [Sediminispirochaeta sp.]